jgi:hypothetical protein
MKTYIVQLERHDDVISARDKISWSKARRVLLVWPRSGKVLERRVDLLLLARHCQQTGAQMAIVTRSGEVKYHARALGIPVFRKPAQAQQSAWRRPGFRSRGWRTGKPALARDLRGQRDALRVSNALQARLVENRWLRLGLFTLAVLAFLGLVLSFAPGAQVSLTPTRETQQLSLAIWASPEIRVPNPSGGMPAHALAVTVEGRAQAESSGRTMVPDRSAAGQVELTNLTDQAVTVPQGSIVITTSTPPIRFATTRPAWLPPGPGTTAMVPIQALAPGRAGNVAANQVGAMEGPLGLKLVVNNPQALAGGTDRASPAPSQEDFRRLRESLLDDLRGTAAEELQALLEPGQRLLASAVRVQNVLAEQREPAESLPAERLELTMRVMFEGWYVEEADLEAAARPVLDASLAEGFQPVPGSFQVAFVDQPGPDGDADPAPPGSVTAQVVIQQTVESAWADAPLIQAIQGRRVEDARRILQERLSLAEPPEIVLYPAWWGRLPFLPARIALVVQ